MKAFILKAAFFSNVCLFFMDEFFTSKDEKKCYFRKKNMGYECFSFIQFLTKEDDNQCPTINQMVFYLISLFWENIVFLLVP